MRGLLALTGAILLAGAGCGKRGGGPPDPRARSASDAATPTDPARTSNAGPTSSEAATHREIALKFLAALQVACEQGSAPPALPLMPSQLRAVVDEYALAQGAVNVVCVRRKLGLPEDEPAGLEEALDLAIEPYPADWVDQLERMCADPGFHYDHLSALEFPKNQYFLMETPREDAMRALEAARCLARRIAGDTPPSQLDRGAQGLLFRLNNLYEGIVARYKL
jgi:hypothetical protein